MRNIKIVWIALMISLSLGACQKFVDVQKNSFLAPLKSASDCQQLLDNYYLMNTGYPTDGMTSSDDCYIKDGFGSLSVEERDFYSWAPGAIRPGADQWVQPYQTVYTTNLVFEALEKLKGNTDQNVLNNLRGTALFFQSFCFWQLAQLYTKPYAAASAATDPGIPLPTGSDINDEYGRGTVADTYGKIVQCLQEAIALLPETSVFPTRPNKAAAYAMLSRVYLSMEDYPQALTNANAALQLRSQLIDYNTVDNSSEVPFSMKGNVEVIFHAVTQKSAPLEPYDNGRIDPALVASYQDNDLRKKNFFMENWDGTHYFIGNYSYDVQYNSVLFCGLAVDELYLTRAECYARAGNTNAALKDLNDLLKTRWNSNGGTTPYQDITAATAEEALGKILTERRKELVMRGLRWTDLRRLNKDSRFKKDLSRSMTLGGVTTVYNLPANDPRYVLLIPDQVIQRSKIAQNTR